MGNHKIKLYMTYAMKKYIRKYIPQSLANRAKGRFPN